MKIFKHKLIATFTIVLFFGLQVFASGFEEYQKEYHQSFTVNSDVILRVSNKFGFVKIVTNETDQINIDVRVSIDAKNPEKAQKLLNDIVIKISGDESVVSAITQLENNTKYKELSIDYTISMPASGNVDITNKFGSFYLNEINGNSKINISYGSADIGNLNSKTNDVVVKFGSGKVKYAHYLNFTSQYSETKIGRAKLLNLDSRYGEVTVGEVGRMNFTSQYSDAYLGTIVELTADVRFGEMKVEGIITKLELKSQYGDADIAFISKDFSEIDIITSFCDVDLSFQSGSNFVLEGNTSFGDINIPGGTTSSVDGKGNSDTYYGKMFEGTTPSTVKAQMSYGDLEIKIH